MKYILLLAFIGLSCNSLFAQNKRGLSNAESTIQTQNNGKTYALIIGISRYKNPAIAALQYADKDAIEFRDFLIASGVDSNHITLYTNENATDGNILTELDDICSNKAQKGDRVFFYFSGHGDVESKVITNDGYLLPYDAPRSVYAISAININILQSYISTLSAHGVQAIVITDACHSGNLSGGLEGMKNISTVLKSQWKDEVKILSCQPGELSLEGKQWGNGRGLFSYELINGMAGDADKNKDGKITLFELNKYMIDKVPDEANPISQIPILTGNMETTVSIVNSNWLRNHVLKTNTNTIAAVDTKGFEEDLVKKLPDSIKRFYASYKYLLENGNKEIIVSTTHKKIIMPDTGIYSSSVKNEKNKIIYHLLTTSGYDASGQFKMVDSLKNYRDDFTGNKITIKYYVYKYDKDLYHASYNDSIPPVDKDTFICTMSGYNISALDYYKKIPENNDTKLLLSIMKRNLIANTISKINESIKNDFDEKNWIFRLNNTWYPYVFSSSIKFTKSEMELLPNIANNTKLKAMGVLQKTYYLRAKYLAEEAHAQNIDTIYKQFIDSSIATDPLATYSLFYKSYNYFAIEKQFDSSIKYAHKVLDISPSIFYCYRILTGCYMSKNNVDSSIKYYQILNSQLAHYVKDSLYKDLEGVAKKGLPTSSGFMPTKIFQLVADNFYRYPTRKLFAIYSMLGNKDSLVKYRNLYFTINDQNNDSTELMLQLYSECENVYYVYKKYRLSIENRFKMLDISHNKNDSFYSYYKIASFYSLLNDKQNALTYFEQSFNKFGNNYIQYNDIQTNTDLDNINKENQFTNVIKKYFPDKYH